MLLQPLLLLLPGLLLQLLLLLLHLNTLLQLHLNTVNMHSANRDSKGC